MADALNMMAKWSSQIPLCFSYILRNQQIDQTINKTRKSQPKRPITGIAK